MGRDKDSEPLWLTRAWTQAGTSARIGTLALCALFFALVADSRPVLAYAAVTPASGGTRLIAGTPATLSGPYIAEAAPGDIGAGDITLQSPPGFTFDTTQYVTATVTHKGSCSSDELANGANSAAPDQSASPSRSSAVPVENQPLLLDGGTSQTVAPAPYRITVTVTQPSSGTCAASIEWSSISIIATAEGSGSITKAPGGSVISGVTDGATDVGWLSATAPPQREETMAPRGSASAKPRASAEPEKQSHPPRLAPEERTTLTPETENTDGAGTSDLGETTGEPKVPKGLSRAKRVASEASGHLFSELVSEEPTSHDQHDSVSQGSSTEAHAPAEALSAMEPATNYSQVVDNASPGRFSAPGWEGNSRGALYYGQDYSYVEPSRAVAPARFKVKIPADDYYTVYAWWPAAEENSAATRYGISTTSGVEWTTVNQQTDGGMWVRLGAYEMGAGDYYAVRVSQGSGGYGEAVADAVQVLSGNQASPEADAGVVEAAGGKIAGGRTVGSKVVRRARGHLGTHYRLSPPARCDAYRKEDCSCHTKVVFRTFGERLADNLVKQYREGRYVPKSRLRPGDLVFFDENRNGKLRPMDHIGIYSGNGYLIHSSSYFGEVVETKMKYIDGYWGARRL
jgi:cell wall-associated NlpC family hydrolase